MTSARTMKLWSLLTAGLMAMACSTAAASLKAAGVPVEPIYIPDADHSFIARTPAATRDATLKATNATFDFFAQRLK